MDKFTIGVAVIAIGVGLGIGYYLPHPSGSVGVRGQFGGTNGQFAGRTGAGGGATSRFAGGGAAAGTIIAKDAKSITVQLGGPTASSTNGSATGTKIVFYDTSTQVDEMQSVPPSNLAIGQDVIVTGTPNSDGSVTAQAIQIRPAGAGPRSGAPMMPAGQ